MKNTRSKASGKPREVLKTREENNRRSQESRMRQAKKARKTTRN
jgi:hypothetical protein